MPGLRLIDHAPFPAAPTRGRPQSPVLGEQSPIDSATGHADDPGPAGRSGVDRPHALTPVRAFPT